ncbi:MAG: NAD(P)H-hydrate epimerase [Planctomycetales bacterium]|nr:NAD(P)H-hydrate epimerase [Planctomycetales bacterium]
MEVPQRLSREQSRAVDRLAIEHYGIPGMVLMENAGCGVVEVLVREGAGLAGGPVGLVGILCGKGNNAGDGFVVARQLAIRGIGSKVVLLASAAELQGDARQNYEILTHCQVPIEDLSSTEDLAASLDAELGRCDWLVDAMLGTGAQGEPREPIRTAIEWMNAQAVRRLAVDVPSGLDCDTGQSATRCVRADLTCTFVAAKIGFGRPEAAEFLGQLHVVSIGIPPQLIAEAAAHSAD